MALVRACERFHAYLYGSDFELLTDHKALQFIFSPRSKPSLRIERWVLRLQPYQYHVTHIPGHTNIADSLSRLQNEISSIGCQRGTRIVIPSALRKRVLELAHKGQPGNVVMKRRLRTNVW